MSSGDRPPQSHFGHTLKNPQRRVSSILINQDGTLPSRTGPRSVVTTFTALLILLLIFAAQESRADPAGLIVYGSDFVFTVREPWDWKGDIEAASHYGSNVVFYRRSETPRNVTTLIVVNVSTKSDEDTAADLEYDMSRYRRRYPGVLFKDIEVSSPRYRHFTKLFCVPDKFYEYVTYLNPGPASHFLLSVSMNTQIHAATPEEIAVYRTVVGSLGLIEPASERPSR